MKNNKIPWENPQIELEDFEEIKKIYPYTKEKGKELISNFESKITKFTSAKHAISVNNGSSAIVCALLANGIKPKDKVALPTYTFASVFNSIKLIGSEPVLIDSDPNTFNMDLEKLENKTKNVSINAIIHVDVGGQPPDIDVLTDLCRDKKMVLIEDAAEGLGTAYKNKRIGNFSHTTTMSFHPAKQLTTLEGGVILTNDESINEKLNLIRNHGMSSTYEHVSFGFNFRLTPLEAALGISQFKKIEKYIKIRKSIANVYCSKLKTILKFQKILPHITDFSWGAVLALVDSNENRNNLIKSLAEKGIETRILWKPVHMQKFFNSLRETLPISEQIFNHVISLPLGNAMSVDEAEIVSESIEEIFAN